MIALGSNEIHMGSTSYLTAVDSSLKHDLSPADHHNNLVSVSQDEVMRILRLWKEQKGGGNPYPEVYKYLHPLVIGALDRSSSLSMRICEELLSYHMKDRRKAGRISRALNYNYPSHSYPITAREARKLGLVVRDLDPGVDSLLRELNQLYSEMAHARITDKDTQNYHNDEICNILEMTGRQVFYQVDKDWHYRKEEKRWISMNDESGWYLCADKTGNGFRLGFSFVRLPGEMKPINPAATFRPGVICIAGLYLGLAALTLFLAFCNLDGRPFWGDEAETALLARNVLKFDVPRVD